MFCSFNLSSKEINIHGVGLSLVKQTGSYQKMAWRNYTDFVGIFGSLTAIQRSRIENCFYLAEQGCQLFVIESLPFRGSE